MDAIQIFVEGSGDVIFLRHAISHLEPTLRGSWKKCGKVDQDESLDDSQIQLPTLTYRVEWKGCLIVVRAMNGVSNIFPMMEPMLTSFCYNVSVDSVKIIKDVFVVDADDTFRDNGNGGILNAQARIQDEQMKCSKLGLDCAGFAMPDNQTDGTLEDILKGMVPAKNRAVIEGCWERFKACAKKNGALFDPPLKSMIDVYAKMFNRKAHGSMFPSSSFADSQTWDWDAPVLNSLNAFLKSEVLDYCANRARKN